MAESERRSGLDGGEGSQAYDGCRVAASHLGEEAKMLV